MSKIVVEDLRYNVGMQKVSKNPDEYINSLPEPVRADMVKLDKEISTIMEGQSRILWEGTFWGGSQQNIIGYGNYTYKRPKGDIEWFIVGLALQKNYISVYVNAVEGKQYLTEKYAGKLGKAKVGKSSISFKQLADVDQKALLELITKARDIMLQQ